MIILMDVYCFKISDEMEFKNYQEGPLFHDQQPNW